MFGDLVDAFEREIGELGDTVRSKVREVFGRAEDRKSVV